MIGNLATFLTALAAIALLTILWYVLIRPVVTKAESVMQVVDESYEARCRREEATAEERRVAEMELEAQLGESSDTTQENDR